MLHAVRNCAEATRNPEPRPPAESRERQRHTRHRVRGGPAPRFGNKEHRERRGGRVLRVCVRPRVLVPATTGTAARPAHPRHSTAPQFELHTPRAPRNMCLSGQPHGAASYMVRVIASVVDPGPIHGGTAPCSKLQCCPGNACPRPLDPAPPPPPPPRPRPLAPHFPK